MPTMPVGPSYRDSSRFMVRARSGSDVTPVTGTGLLCGVSPSRAPSTTTISTPNSCAKPRISLQNERQRMLGSMPRTSTRSRGLPLPPASSTRTTASRVVGQVILREPPSSHTCGLLTWKS
jgi:hypothetical protein